MKLELFAPTQRYLGGLTLYEMMICIAWSLGEGHDRFFPWFFSLKFSFLPSGHATSWHWLIGALRTTGAPATQGTFLGQMKLVASTFLKNPWAYHPCMGKHPINRGIKIGDMFQARQWLQWRFFGGFLQLGPWSRTFIQATNYQTFGHGCDGRLQQSPIDRQD